MYAEHFGLSKLPFSVTPDPQLFFSNSLYREVFAKLQYGVAAKKGFIVVAGEVGTGKTTLLRKLLHSLGPTVHSVFIFNTQVNFLELLRLILEDLNLPRGNEDKVAMIETLNAYLIERLRQGHIVTLLIDEAQNLCDEALEGLRLLSNLESDTEKLLQIILMGQPELETKLDQPRLRQLKQRITLHCRLVPLRKEEVGPYIEFRLNAAGFRGKNPFDAISLDAIARYSRGIPRLINVICDNALLSAFAASKREVPPEVVEQVARDLQLRARQSMETIDGEHNRPPPKLAKPPVRDEEPLPEFEKVFAGAQREHWRQPQGRHNLTGLGIGLFLGAVVLGGIAVSYSPHGKIDVSSLSESWTDFSREGQEVFSSSIEKAGSFFEEMQQYLREEAVKAQEISFQAANTMSAKAGRIYNESATSVAGLLERGKDSWRATANYVSRVGEEAKEFSLRSRNYVADLAARMRSAVRSRWEALKDAVSVRRLSEAKSAMFEPVESADMNPSKSVQPMPEDGASKPSARGSGSTKPRRDSDARVPETKTSAEARIARGTAGAAQSRADPAAPRARATEPSQAGFVKPENGAAEPSHKAPSRYPGNFEVVANSFVRARPESDAEIITTLRPGSTIRVESKSGKYYRIRSLDEAGVRGYVHEEDAFFERAK